MEFHENLQRLRKQRGLTQEELAQQLFVSRAAVSKWESGRGYPNIDSLKLMARFFGVTIDALLSGEEVLAIAEDDHRQKQARFRDLVLGTLDCGAALLLFLPIFGQTAGGTIQAVPLLSLTGTAPWLRGLFLAVLLGMAASGLLTLTLRPRWRTALSLCLNGVGGLLFTICRQPYGAVLLLLFLAIKMLILTKKAVIRKVSPV